MGSSSHLKRLAIPRSWPLPRKTTVWVTRPRAGAHTLERSIPINIVIRDVLGMAHSTREVRTILHNGLARSMVVS
jgi:small subunit ribosomal protein S4e